MEIDSQMCQQSDVMFNSTNKYKTLFDETAKDIFENSDESDLHFSSDSERSVLTDLNAFLSNALDPMQNILNDDMTYQPNETYNFESGDLLEIGQNVTVYSNPSSYFSPLLHESSSFLSNSSCLLSPQSMGPSSPISDIIVEEIYYYDDSSFDNAINSDLTLRSSPSSSEIDFDQNLSSGASENSLKKTKRGRPRKTPEEHLRLLALKTNKKEKKVIKNNAASIKYRHKKASERENTEKLYTKATERQNTLQRRHAKLESDIEKLKQITRSRFS